MSKTSRSKGLGRGLGSLIPSDLDTDALLQKEERIQNILISQIKPAKDQPRTIFDQTALDELASSIKERGVIQPIILTQNEQNSYTIIAGERRWRAAQQAGLERIPAIVRSAQALERLELALIENVQRVDLSPLEQAVSVEYLHQQFSMTYADIAARLGKAPTTLNNIVRLLGLPPAAREALSAGVITEGHARAILALKNWPKRQAELLDSITQGRWSVRQAEQFVLASKEEPKKPASAGRMQLETTETRRLGEKLGSQVSLRRLAKGGKIEIRFKDDKDLVRIVDLLS